MTRYPLREWRERKHVYLPHTSLCKVKTETHTCNSTGSITFADFLEVMSEVMGQTTKWGSMQTKLEGYVGFDTIQEQIRRKSLRKGFEFNVMVVGE